MIKRFESSVQGPIAAVVAGVVSELVTTEWVNLSYALLSVRLCWPSVNRHPESAALQRPYSPPE